ncbi:MAG: beta-galactosidase [Chloroflexota bacterium]
MHYGVAYYPEQWSEETWSRDAALMAQAGLTVVRLAEFAWTRLETHAGHFTFEWLDRVIDCLAEHQLKIVLGTPTAGPPHWLVTSHPDMLFVTAEGRRMAPQSRRFICLNNNHFRAASERIVTALAQRYGRHPAVIGWQIDNEFGCHDTVRCYCTQCQTGFREWLQTRYGSLDHLNKAWGTVFWSQEYNEWEQIAPPQPTATYHNPGHVLDFYRYSAATVCDYQQMQITILRDYTHNQFICHNFMAGFDQLEHSQMSQPLDMVTWDNYIDEGMDWHDVARFHDMIRGLKHQPFWIMESPPAQVNWTRHNPTLRHGEARLRSWHAIAHGADGIFYFHWRAFRSGAEQLHSAILPHDGLPGRVYDETAALGQELKQVQPLLTGTSIRAKVAILTDIASHWSLQHQPHNEALSDPSLYIQPWYRALLRRNIAVEFCQPDEDLEAYQLVIAPSLHILTDQIANNLQRYVSQGGTLILGPRTGWRETSNTMTSLPLPGLLADLAGVRVTEWASLPPGQVRHVHRKSAGISDSYEATLWYELLELHNATALAHYDGGDEHNAVAITHNEYGQGSVTYVGVLGDMLIDAIAAHTLRSLQMEGILATPVGVEAILREGPNGAFLFLLNHTAHAQKVTLSESYYDILANEWLTAETGLTPFDVRIVQIN